MQVVEDLTDRLDDESRIDVEMENRMMKRRKIKSSWVPQKIKIEKKKKKMMMQTEILNALWLEAGRLIQTRPAVVRMEVMAEDAVHVDEEGLSLLLLLQKHFIWEGAITAMLKVAWEKLCAPRYADFTYRMRKNGKKQQCISQEIWESWQKAWEDPAFKRKCEIFIQNRHSETGGDGAGPSRHTSESISAIETSQLSAEKYGREPTPIEIFTYTHIKDHDGNTFVDRHELGVNPDDSAEEISALRAHVDEQERQLVELRAHVMRMSGQHGAGTSSSYPPPAIVS
ncbi:hypothetical protein JCGZ_24258 [Jatropha curcas]|uniref:Uncharacterized protein n=1 Tax=Jatropha curcas TaxID=180498 RepID=A0A067JME8_JATCU|nr:hypothetical protein JCGZ_24258 [Jatropha curcas]